MRKLLFGCRFTQVKAGGVFFFFRLSRKQVSSGDVELCDVCRRLRFPAFTRTICDGCHASPPSLLHLVLLLLQRKTSPRYRFPKENICLQLLFDKSS